MKASIAYSALAISVMAAIFFGIKSSSLKKQLTEAEKQQSENVEKLQSFEQLTKIDSMLLNGDYNSVIDSYQVSADFHKENKTGIPLRIALAEKLLHERRAAGNFLKNQKNDLDSLSAETASAQQIRKFDSLNFTLEKTKVQLTRLRSQLKEKSFGEYLKFKSLKGNQMHYVGQVKNGKANGFGIALLDTGSRYEGEWKNNQRHGQGTFYWADGQSYAGTYDGDKRNGFGTYYWPNGEKYQGEWQDDKRSGTGKFFGTDGAVVARGVWSEDKLIETERKGGSR